VVQSFAHLGLAAEKVDSTPTLMCNSNCVATLVGGFMLTQEKLKERLHYDPLTGDFTWKAIRCTRMRDGSVAGGKNGGGYVHIKINGKKHYAHRLAWLYTHGSFPENHIDHINGNTSDNRIENLREATQSQNAMNRIIRVDNKSGFKGVHFDKGAGKYKAQIMINGKRVCLGLFDCPKKASGAYAAAADKHYKQFANHG